ncbi:hypothetical protein GEMRC1_003155 [Eukaryota sp. GEM-RC1]
MGRGVRAKSDIDRVLIMGGKAFAAHTIYQEPSVTMKLNPYDNYADGCSGTMVVEKTIEKLASLPTDSPLRRKFFDLASGKSLESSTGQFNIEVIEQTTRTNWFQISNDDHSESSAGSEGCGLFLDQSLFNHSCAPNCSYILSCLFVMLILFFHFPKEAKFWKILILEVVLFVSVDVVV